MQPLASAIREQLDTLVDRYDARLRTMPGYSGLPEPMRRELERHVLDLIAQCLETADYQALVQYVQQRVVQWEATGFPLIWFQQALVIPEEILTPLIRSVAASNFLWQALNRSQGVVWQLVADHAHQTEERFRSIVETSHSGVLITDDTFHLTYVNDELMKISGYTREELLGVDFRQLLDEESRQIVADRYLRRQRGEDVLPRYEIAFLRKDGTKRHIEMSAVSLTDLNGKMYTVAQVLDITERNLSERALWENQQFLQLVLDNIPQAVFWKDRNSIFLGCNRNLAQAVGAAGPEQIVGKSDYDVSQTKEEAEAFRADDRAVIEGGQPKYHIIEPLQLPDGKQAWLDTSKVPLRNAAGEVIGVLGMFEDITERRTVDMALRENESKLRAIYEGSNDAIMLLNARGFFDCNTQTLNLFGVESKETFTRLHPSDLSPAYQPDGQDSLTASQQKILTAYQQGHNRFEWVHQRVSGEAFPAEVLLSAFEYGGEQVLQATVRDITERKRAEAALARSAEKQQELSQRLRAAIEAADELMGLPDLDTVYRRAVELAREKLGVERCGLFVVDPSQQFVVGTYGTDDQGQTLDEHAVRDPIEKHQTMFLSQDKLWVVQEAPQRYWENGEEQIVGTGWVGGTAMRSESGPIGVLYNDAALSKAPPDPDLQETLAVYCSMLGSIIKRKRLEQELTAAQQQFQNIIEFLPDATFVIDRNKRVIAWNRAIEEMSGLAKEDILGQGDYAYAVPFFGERRPIIIDLIGTPDPEIEANYNYVRRQGDTLYAETFVPTMFGGRGAHVSVTASPLLDDAGHYAGAIESIRDITERTQLEQQIQESLVRRDAQVHTSTEVAQEIAAAPDLNELFQRVVTLIKERFNFYHAQIFRYEPALDAVVLVTGYGEIGQHMLADRHQLAMGRGVVGTAAASGQSILASDVTQDADWRPNPHLPDTKGELAVPIKLHDKVLGILDVQSDRAGALSADDRLLLEGLCGQIASAMDSTRLLEELRRGEAELSQTLRIAKLAYWEYDVAKDLFHFNDQFYSIFHTTAEQEGGYQLSSAQYAGKFVYPDDLPVVGAEIERALNSTDRHYSRDLVHRIQYADGGVGYISVSINIDRDEQGHILRYYGANQDITERKQIEEALAQEQSLMHVLMETVNDHIYFKDLQSRFLRISKSQADRFGLSDPALAVGKTDFDYFTEEHARPAYEDEQAIIRTGQPITKEERETWQDQPDTWVSTTKFPLRDETSNIVGTFGISHDITERKRAEEEVRRTQRFLDSIIENIPIMLFVKEAKDLRQVRWSKAGEDLLGVPRADLIGKNDLDLFPAEEAAFFMAKDRQVLANKELVDIPEEPFHTRFKGIRTLHTQKIPILDEQGNAQYLLGISEDITERKQAEAERERLLAEQQKRALQLQTASEVSRAASSILNIENLLPQVADLVRDRFNFYYVGVFLKDDTERWAVLRAGTGETGQEMLANGHKLKIGGNSMISQCIVTQQARIALDVGEEAVRFDNPLLPLTRSEMALPLISRGRIIGAVTIQSDQPLAFSADDIAVLQSMADQISNAVENARLYERAQVALQEVDAINRRLTGEAWESYLRQQAGRQVMWAVDDEAVAPDALSQLDDELAAGEITIEPDPENQLEATVTAPILLRGQPIGALRLRTPLDEWDDDAETVLADVAGHIAQAVENARLVEQTQRTAHRERSINEINARVRQSVDLDAILRTAVNELGQSLKAARVVARVGTTAAEGATTTGDGRGKTND